MDIQDLRIFSRVAALQNLSAVAAELGLTAGTISKRIQALEDELKARLFDRTTRSIRITDEGARFLAHAERILDEVDQAQAGIRASSERPAGRLKLSAPAALSHCLVTPALVGFVEAFPDIDVRVDITDRLVNLQEEGYDAAIRAGVLNDCSLIAKRLVSDRMILVASRGYIDRSGAPSKPADLTEHACLLQGDQRSWTLTRGRDQDMVRVFGRLQSDNGVLLHDAALAGLGILRASEIAVAPDLASGRLVRVMPEYEVAANAGIWVVYPSAKHVLPRLRALLDHLALYCREHLAGGASEAPLPSAESADQIVLKPRRLVGL